jgi:predicted membrane-bound spermidine synthase
MSDHILSRIFGRRVDERFLNHRLRSTSLAGIIGGVSASLLFLYRFYVNHVWSWDLLSIAIVIVGVKMGMMLWYLLTD